MPHPDPDLPVVVSSHRTGTPADSGTVAAAERSLGRPLPAGYVRLLRVVNGGELVRRFCPTPFPTSWDPAGFAVSGVLGIGDAPGAVDGETGSDYLVSEWEYPPVGVVFCDTPSAGHDTVMLDYRLPGEPTVVYVDEDCVPRTVAVSFDAFLAMLTVEPDY